MKKIILASNNPGKAREINQLLEGVDFEIISQSDFGVPEVEETGLTFIENAILKARNACHYCHLPAIADDSGLEIDALNGAPGIYSSRFAGIDANDRENLEKALSELKEIPAGNRTARFQCLMVFLAHEYDPTPVICQGTWEGSILNEPVGNNGFGYDPIFYVPTHDCSSAELPADTKNRLSHRGQALTKLIKALKETL